MLWEVVRHAILLLLAVVATTAAPSTASFLMPTTSSMIQRNCISSYAGHTHNNVHKPSSTSFHHHSVIQSRRSSHLNVVIGNNSNTIAAGTTLLLSSTTGMLLEQKLNGGGIGHVITLLLSALLSNISQLLQSSSSSRIPWMMNIIIPTEHYLYDWCWSVFLPASLVFALLSSSSSASASTKQQQSSYKRTTNNKATTTSTIMKSTILGMTLPFLLGTLGSIMGCISSFHFLPLNYTKQISALLAGCLCASYIGGTVNFFATAKILLQQRSQSSNMIGSSSSSSSSSVGSAFGSMAAADLVVMAIYFCMLQVASRSSMLHKLFPSKLLQQEVVDKRSSKVVENNDCIKDENVDVKEVVGVGSHGDHIIVDSTKSEKNTTPITTTIPSRERKFDCWHSINIISSMGIAASIALGLGSVTIATRLERIVLKTLGIPGTMCAFLALFGITFERLIHYTINAHQKWKPGVNIQPLSSFTNGIKSLQQVSNVSPILSNMCFHLLFAAVGTTADLSSAIVGGPKALGFASLALVVHSITVLVGTYVSNCLLLLRRRRRKRLLSSSTTVILTNEKKKKKMLRQQWPLSSWEEVLTASNAAIGGPSTAAAFAVSLIPNNDDRNNDDGGGDKLSSVERKDDERSKLRSALVIGATFWGVFGYAIATGIGVTLSRMLMR